MRATRTLTTALSRRFEALRVKVLSAIGSGGDLFGVVESRLPSAPQPAIQCGVDERDRSELV
ncbi:MAG TPA: hypothetical protein VGZ04_11090 [Acidimicrobiales bacterium]|nr:hypothetical protein [Acidimicrobiales bacterium]